MELFYFAIAGFIAGFFICTRSFYSLLSIILGIVASIAPWIMLAKFYSTKEVAVMTIPWPVVWYVVFVIIGYIVYCCWIRARKQTAP